MTANESHVSLVNRRNSNIASSVPRGCVSLAASIFFVLIAVILLFEAILGVQPVYDGAVEDAEGDEKFRIDSIFFANFVSLLAFAAACLGAAMLRDLHAKLVMFTILLSVLVVFLLIALYAVLAGWRLALTIGFVQNQIFPLLGVGFLSTVIGSHIMHSFSKFK